MKVSKHLDISFSCQTFHAMHSKFLFVCVCWCTFRREIKGKSKTTCTNVNKLQMNLTYSNSVNTQIQIIVGSRYAFAFLCYLLRVESSPFLTIFPFPWEVAEFNYELLSPNITDKSVTLSLPMSCYMCRDRRSLSSSDALLRSLEFLEIT